MLFSHALDIISLRYSCELMTSPLLIWEICVIPSSSCFCFVVQTFVLFSQLVGIFYILLELVDSFSISNENENSLAGLKVDV